MTSIRMRSLAARPGLRRHGRRPGGAGSDTARVRVRGGYEPSVIYARAGVPLVIVFLREETAACSDRVVFPTLGKSAMLPPYRDVRVEVVPPAAGEYAFTCAMGVLHGRLVVSDGAPR